MTKTLGNSKPNWSILAKLNSIYNRPYICMKKLHKNLLMTKSTIIITYFAHKIQLICKT